MSLINYFTPLPKTKAVIAVACAHDVDVLKSLVLAKQQGLADGILVGDKDKIETILTTLESENEFEIIDQPDPIAAVNTSIQLIHQQKANILMKGFVDTSVLLKQVVQSDTGIKSSSLFSFFLS